MYVPEWSYMQDCNDRLYFRLSHLHLRLDIGHRNGTKKSQSWQLRCGYMICIKCLLVRATPLQKKVLPVISRQSRQVTCYLENLKYESASWSGMDKQKHSREIEALITLTLLINFWSLSNMNLRLKGFSAVLGICSHAHERWIIVFV